MPFGALTRCRSITLVITFVTQKAYKMDLLIHTEEIALLPGFNEPCKADLPALMLFLDGPSDVAFVGSNDSRK